MKAAIVILNFNGAAFLKQFLPTLIEYSGGNKIIVADNDSSDDSVALLESDFSEVRCIQLKENHGYAGGYNQALEQINATYYVLINSDIEVSEAWLQPLLDFLDKNNTYAGVQPKIRSHSEKTKFEYAGAAGGLIDSLGYPYCRGRIFDECEIDSGQYDDNLDVFWTTGACMAIRSKDFHSVGGFDADFFAHMEEIDLCWRLSALDRKFACIPESIVYHVGGGTLSKTSPRKTYLNFRNGLMLLLKNLPANQLWKIPVRMILDLIAGFKFWLDYDFSHLKAVINAQSHFISSIRSGMNKRVSVSDFVWIKPIKVRSIVWQYYARSRKRYSQLK